MSSPLPADWSHWSSEFGDCSRDKQSTRASLSQQLWPRGWRSGVNCKWWADLSSNLFQNHHLVVWSFPSLYVTTVFFISSHTALCRNRTLVTLELGTNGLTDVSARLLGDALKLNFRLQGLSLWQNEITGQGAQCLAEGLQSNSTLLWLGLGSNRIGTEGTWALSESLKSNVTLLWLGLGGNELGDRGALHLATLLQSKSAQTFSSQSLAVSTCFTDCLQVISVVCRA